MSKRQPDAPPVGVLNRGVFDHRVFDTRVFDQNGTKQGLAEPPQVSGEAENYEYSPDGASVYRFLNATSS